FALHVIALPLALLLLVVLHILALHEVGSNNPDGIDIKKGPKGNRWNKLKPADGIPFHPYYSVHDIFAAGVFITLGAAIIFFAPTVGGWFRRSGARRSGACWRWQPPSCCSRRCHGSIAAWCVRSAIAGWASGLRSASSSYASSGLGWSGPASLPVLSVL